MAQKTKKYTRLTNKEKQHNKEFRAELRADGILPPKKIPLNRNKFAKEVKAEFDDYSIFTNIHNFYQAVCFMLPYTGDDFKVKISAEQIGVLKVMKIAVEIEKFQKRLKEEDRTEYSLKELFEVVRPIIDL